MNPVVAEVTAISTADFESVLTTIQSQISVSTVVSVLALGAGAAVGLVFMWWGVRKLIKMLMAAFKKSRLSA